MNIAAIIVGIDGSRNVLPRSALEQSLYRLWIDIVLGCKLSVSHFARGVTLANFRYLFSGQLGVTRAFSKRLSLSPFGDHVLRIVEICSKKQMRGINASRVVAMVADDKAIWDGAVRELIGESVGVNIARFVSELAVTIGAFVAKPKPTLVSLSAINQCPKILFCWVLTKAMPAEKSTGLPLDPSVSLVVCWRDFGFSTATAVAVTVGNIVRGMIVHSKFSLSELAHATGRFAVVAVATLLAATGVIIPYMPHVEGMVI